MAFFEIINNLFLTLGMGDVYIDGNNKYPILVIEKVDHSKLMTCSSKTIVSFFRFGMTDCPLVFVFGFYE